MVDTPKYDSIDEWEDKTLNTAIKNKHEKRLETSNIIHKQRSIKATKNIGETK